MLGRRRGKLGTALLGAGLYAAVGLTAAGVRSPEPAEAPSSAASCPADLLRTAGARDGDLTILQGNLWMLPTRLLVVPYPFSTDRTERLRRLIETVRRCRPAAVALQEVFDQSVVAALEESLPGYRLVTSGDLGFMGHFNVSGLVTLTRLPLEDVDFRPFGALPEGASLVERLSGKGFLVTRIDAPGFQGNLVNLHLYAAHDSADAPMTRVQLERVLAFAQAEERRGRASIVVGDFNLSRSEMERLLPPGWTLSRHGPTYDPVRNPYTSQGANGGGPWKDESSVRTRVRAIDFLAISPTGRLSLRSRVLDRLPLSDHYFLEHAVAADR